MSSLEWLLQWQLPFYDLPPQSWLGSGNGISHAIPIALEREGAKKPTSMPRNIFAACLSPTHDCSLSPARTPKNWKRVQNVIFFPADRRTGSSNTISSRLGNFDKTSLICFYFFSVCTLYQVSLLSYRCFLSLSPYFSPLLSPSLFFPWPSCAKDLQRKTDPDCSFSLCPKLF